MIDDSERRDVAARLRSIKDTREGCEHELCCDLWYAIFNCGYRCIGPCDECETAVLNRLADLIEPSPPCEFWDSEGQECYSIRTARPVDRDALLALADEMVEMFRLGAFTGEGLDAKWCRELHGKYVSRIREALGVQNA